MLTLAALWQYTQTYPLTFLAALVATYVIGFLWHGPLFGQLWIKLNGMKPPKKKDVKFSMMLPGLSANLVLALVETAVLGALFMVLSVPTMWDALILTKLLWLPFTALVIINIYAWGGKPAKLVVLDVAHSFVSIMAVAAIVYGMM